MNLDRKQFKLSVVLEAPLSLMVLVAIICTIAVIGAAVWTVIP